MTGLTVVANASLGSSHATMIPYRLPALENVQADVLILDVCVNEQRAASRNLYDLNQSTQYLNFLLAWCQKRDMMPVVLLLPIKGTRHLQNGPTVNDHWRYICRHAQIPYFDGDAFVANATAQSGQPSRTMFKDRHHLDMQASTLLAKMLSERLTAFHAAARRRIRFGLAHTFRYVPLDGDTHRATSLVSERFRRLEPGDEVTVDCGAGDVVGAVLNMAQTNASIQLNGRTSSVKRLDSPYFNPDRELWLVAWSMLKPVATKRGKIAIRPMASSRDPAFEDNDHSNGKLPSPEHQPVVELAGLVIRERARIRRLFSTRGAELDLASAPMG
jgi:hypothetical protein